MSKPAKNETALLKRAGEAIRKALIKPPGCMESTGCAVGPCHCAHLAAEAALAAIRAAGWAVVPVEPTEEMLHGFTEPDVYICSLDWEAILAASPIPPGVKP